MAISDHLALTQDQRALQGSVREFLADQLPSAALRRSVNSEIGYDAQLHSRLAGELGLAGLTIPEEFRGLGMSQAEACVVHTELGRVLYPGPFLPGCLAAGALLAAGDVAACKRWLPALADGSATGTAAAADQAGSWSPGPGDVRAERTPDGWRLDGSRWYVLAGHTADIIVVPADTGSGLSMFVVESGSPGLAASQMPGIDLTRRACALAFEATPASLLGDGGDATAVLDRVEQDFRLATAAEAAGGIDWCLDASVAYAKTREQFGRPIGSYQAIAHSCVDMLAALQSASAAARYAAVASAEGAVDAPLAARVAALRAGESYRDVSEAAIHLFGGIGFTWEHDAHLYYRRAWSAQRLAGGPQAHRAAIADLAGL
jgi:alkylation response protein AidB-like acyl-CoA dehydrogenase